MSPRLPRLTAKNVIKLIEKRGFRHVRTAGSHYIYENESGRMVSVPFHAGKILHPKLLKSILSIAGIDPTELS